MKRACPFDANLLRMTKVHLMEHDVDILALKKLQEDTLLKVMNASKISGSISRESSTEGPEIDNKKSLKQTDITSYLNVSGNCLQRMQTNPTNQVYSSLPKCSYCDVITASIVVCGKCRDEFCESCSLIRYESNTEGHICLTCS